MNILIFLIVGAIAGWLAGQIVKGGNYGLGMNIVIGVVGAVIGGLVFGLLGLSAHNIIGSIITATVGAVILLWVAPRLFKR